MVIVCTFMDGKIAFDGNAFRLLRENTVQLLIDQWDTVTLVFRNWQNPSTEECQVNVLQANNRLQQVNGICGQRILCSLRRKLVGIQTNLPVLVWERALGQTTFMVVKH